MFTGIVEELGTIEAVEQQRDAVRLSVRADLVLGDVHLGDSISVNGCCLTVVSTSATDGDGDAPNVWTADVMQETLDKTSLLGAGPGDRVNLERAVTAGTRLGGHIVQGHVDGVGTIRRREPSEHWELVEIDLPPSLARYLVDKGSITVDGVSLTVVSTSLDQRTGVASFTVSLIPETLRRTTLGFRQPGERVNLEVDVIAKYVERLLAPRLTTTPDHSLTPKDAQ
jgi:riboflavin synthase